MKSSKSFFKIAALFITLLQSVIHAFAQPSTPRDSTWITNGKVTAVAYAKGLTYIGGDFTYVGPNTGHGAALSTTTGAPDLKFPRVNGPIYAMTPDGADGWYIGGNFTKVGNFTRNKLARIKADGTVDPNWAPSNVTGSFSTAATHIIAIAVSGSTVYIGGNFTSVDGQERHGLAALNATTGQVTSWNPDASNIVRALAIKGETVYVGGDFLSISGESRIFLAAIDIATGKLTSWNPGMERGDTVDRRIFAVVVKDTLVFAGGQTILASFSITSGRRTAWNPVIWQDFPFGPTAVYALAVKGSTLYVGGSFPTINGIARPCLAAFSIDSNTLLSWNPSASSAITAICLNGSTVYVGSYNKIAALDETTGQAAAWTSHTSGLVHALATNSNGSVVYAGGNFRSIGGQSRNRLAALNAQTGIVHPWNPTATVNGNIYAIAVSSSNIYIGGAFTMVGNSIRYRVAAINAATGALTTWNPNANAEVHALTIDDATVYAGGKFTAIGGQTRNRLAALDINTGLAKSWNPNVGGNGVYTILANSATVYAGGDFYKIGDFSSQALAAIDANTGLVTAWNPNLNPASIVYAMALDGATLYIGGEFNTVKGQTRNRLAAVDLTSANPTAWNPDVNGTVRALALNEANVYAGGDFTSIGSQTRNYLAAINESTGIPTDWNPNPNNFGSGQGLIAVGSAILAGGTFTTMDGNVHDYFAQFGNIVVTNNPPNAPIALNQYTQHDNAAIPEGGTINANLVVFKATLSDPNDEPVKLQIELRKITEAFTGVPTHESSPANSGTAVSITTDNLAAAHYKWRYRVMDAFELATAWVEFGTPGNTDFVINTVPLPAAAAYGNIPGEDQSHPNEVTYIFPGRAGHLHLSFQAYDIDTPDEVKILLNGTQVANAPLTADNQWSGNLGVVLPDALVNNASSNLVIFDNTKNPPGALQWGVRQVSIENCFELPSTVAYGKIPSGNQTHVDRVIYWFPGKVGDVNLFYEAYDINDTDELDIIFNGTKLRDEAITAANSWSTIRTLLLPEAMVNDTETNIVIFDNTKNPPNALNWGVKNVSIALIAGNTPPAAPTTLQQLKTNGTTVIPEGGTTGENKVVFKGTVSDPDGEQVKLQIELRKIAEAFTGAPNLQSSLVNSGTPVTIAVENLAATNYKWRCRAMDEKGFVSVWGEFGTAGNTDFVVNQPPNAPTAVNQFKSNGTTAIPEGGTTNESKVVFKATTTDPDGEQVKFQIELRKIAEAFTGTPNLQSSLVNSGTPATIAAENLGAANYKWRFRAMDTGGLANAWAEFGTPSNTDFTVNAPLSVPIYPAAVSSQLVGEEFWVNVYVGTNTKPVGKLFGLGFVLEFTQTNYIDVVTPHTSSIIPAAFIGAGNSVVLHQVVDEEAGQVNVGISRQNGQSTVNGYGVVLRVKFVSRPNTPGGTQVKFSISNVTANDSLGNSIPLSPGAIKNITLNPSPTRTVWPGDTNNDGVVNQTDILPLGIYWGAVGLVRPNASMQWSGQSCPSWAQPMTTYADATGNGIVDQGEIAAIGLNWRKTHSPLSPPADGELTKSQTPAGATIRPEIIPAVQPPSREFFMKIKVAEVNDLFGLSFELAYDQAQLLQVLTVEPDSLFGNDVVFYSNIDADNGKIAVGISRKVGQASVNGDGAVVRVKAKIAASATAGAKINLSLQNVVANDANGTAMGLSPQAASLTVSSTTGIDSNGETSAPINYRLLQNHPNPFNAGTVIKYEIPQTGPVSLKIYNLAGQEILEMVNAVQSPGRYQINWDGRDSFGKTVPSGIYICRIQAGTFVQTQRMIMVR